MTVPKPKPCPVCGKPPRNRVIEAAAALVNHLSPGGFA